MTDSELTGKVSFLKRLGVLALFGLAVVAIGTSIHQYPKGWELVPIFAGVLAVVPAVAYVVVLSIWHWKARYRGARSNLWGVLLVVETSGWFKLVYLFRHILPDANGTGRYVRGDRQREA